MSQTDDWIREHHRLQRLMNAVVAAAELLRLQRNEPATMPEGVLGSAANSAGPRT